MKYRLNFNGPLLDPDGKPAGSITLAALLAKNIAVIPAVDAEKQLPILKLWNWQKALAAGEEIEVDRPDLDRFEALVPFLGLVVFSAAQVLEVIAKAKDAAEK